MTVETINPHGFCAGVKGALERAQKNPGAYCLHEIVHNQLVVDGLKTLGMTFVESLDEIPEGGEVIFSAHGVSPAVRSEAAVRHLSVVDATCPFVVKVHRDARRFAEEGLAVVVIGHKGHAEVAGIVGEVEDVPSACAYIYPELPARGTRIGVVSQTTMNRDDVERIIANLRKDYIVETSAQVCNATKERQDAVKAFTGDAIVVLGGANSSNTLRLVEVAHCRAWRAGDMEELKAIDFSGVKRLGVTAGASTPESFLDEAVSYLKGLD